jgi:hypothetical protein
MLLLGAYSFWVATYREGGLQVMFEFQILAATLAFEILAFIGISYISRLRNLDYVVTLTTIHMAFCDVLVCNMGCKLTIRILEYHQNTVSFERPLRTWESDPT